MAMKNSTYCFGMKWLHWGTCVSALVLNAVMAAFALYGIGLYDACVSGGSHSSYDIAIPYYVGSSFAALLALYSVGVGASAVVVGLLCFARRQVENAAWSWRVGCILLVVVSVAAAIAGCMLMGSTISYMQSELEKSEANLPGEYIEDEAFSEMTLDDLKSCFVADSGFGKADESESYLVYIGREGCKECDSFEKAISPILSSDGVDESLLAYYTSEDRDGPRSGEMYSLLDDVDVDSVPTVMVVLDGKVLFRWDNPVADIDQIESYLRTGRLPS